MHSPTLSDFIVIRPQFTTSQEDAFEWIVSAHTEAEQTRLGVRYNTEQKHSFSEELRKNLHHVGCKPGIIHQRGHECSDFLHQRWNEMLVYRLEKYPEGERIGVRQELHQEIVARQFERFYHSEETFPEEIFHVSCTGYSSPSGAQKLVSNRGWGDKTAVTNLFHMGCYGAVPAIRIGSHSINARKERVDIVHTELCTLHMNPSNHNADQLVSQSLFADGFIKYSLKPEVSAKKTGKPYFKLLSVHEQVLPNSQEAMKWLVTDWGFQFVLAKEIPLLIAAGLQNFVATLCHKAGVDFANLLTNGIFAIHPGGPKILDYIQKLLKLRDEQLEASRQILQQYGNMSSATLPHIWELICDSERIASPKIIISLAFGPGLTIAGTILEKRG